MYRYNKRTLLRRCGISYREIFRRCKYTNIFVAVQIIGHFFCVHYYKRKIPMLKQDCKAWGRRLFCRQ